MICAQDGKPARTFYKVLARTKGPDGRARTLLACRIEHGRTHQIRVHMAYIGHPVAGDPLYGGGRAELGLTSQCLHARSIRFIHPTTGEPMSFDSDLPEEFTRALNALRGAR